jgi:sulfoxide reductase catalytic subunit YedY
MLVRSRSPSSCLESSVTPESVYWSRRKVLGGLLAGTAAGLLPSAVHADARYPDVPPDPRAPTWLQQQLSATRAATALPAPDGLTPFVDATHYNNFYEFGPDKDDPARHAPALQTEPWTVQVDGEVGKPGRYTFEDLIRPAHLEERIYRLRCVEAWSMVIPWLGVPLADLIKRFEPNSKARYLRFETLVRAEQMPGVRSGFAVINWPYVEGLRMDEAMHPLTLIAVGIYGRTLPNQNGAPLRLVVPWKYGFKSIKSIVRISFVSEQPINSWQAIASDEYGFYANVNPQVDHPRWSQARERRLPASLFSSNNRDTQLFNGYQDEVASLYGGMDLSRDY